MNITLPNVLYKYTYYRYALKMVVEGSIRVGTLKDYRDEDKYGLEIADKGEGTQTTRMGRFKPIDPKRHNTIPSTIKRQIEMGHFKFDSGIKNFTIYGNVNELVPNLYVYSLSTNKDVIKAFEKAAYDSIIEINNPLGFIEVLTRQINWRDSSIITCKFNPIEYIRREQEIETQTSTHPIFVKDPIHSGQKEYRLVWEAGGKEIEPFIFNNLEIKNYMKLIHAPH